MLQKSMIHISLGKCIFFNRFIPSNIFSRPGQSYYALILVTQGSLSTPKLILVLRCWERFPNLTLTWLDVKKSKNYWKKWEIARSIYFTESCKQKPKWYNRKIQSCCKQSNGLKELSCIFSTVCIKKAIDLHVKIKNRHNESYFTSF